jgi:autotransporter-associated beta strand protein
MSCDPTQLYMTFITRSSLTRSSFLIVAASVVAAPGYLFASSFDITGSSTSAQSLSGGQTGTVEATGSLTVSGGTVAVTLTGNNATVTNLGTMKQTGTGRVIRDNTGVTGLTVTNGSLTNSTALMQSADADVIQMNVAGGSLTLNNYGTMNSLNASKGGAQAVDFNAITTGANTINNFATGVMTAQDADAVRPGVNGVVNNSGLIKSVVTTDTGSDGVDVQANNGVSVMNFTGGTIEGARHGITGGPASDITFTTSVTNQSGATIQGDNGSGINLDGFSAKQTATVMNAGTIIGNGVTGDGDGVDVDGPVTLTNTGTIKSLNAFVASGVEFSEGVTVGGGSITNSGSIQGLVAAGNTHAVGRGITLVGNDIGGGARDPIYSNASVINQSGGLILGQTDCGICVGGNKASGFTVTITNQAGATIQGGVSTIPGVSAEAAIVTGLDNDTINESGLIDGHVSGMAINMGGGNNQLNVTGGSASILGSIDGGAGGTNTMSINPGSGNNFAYSGAISDFSLVDVLSGLVTLSGTSTYTGTTEIDGGVLDLDGTNRLTGDGALDLNGGTLEISDAAVNGETFGCLSLTLGSTIDLGGSSLTFGCLGTIASGDALTVNGYVGDDPATYAFRFVGDDTANADFLRLMGDTTVNGQNARFAFDGAYTDVFVTPEPSTFALFGAAGMLVAVLRRRRAGKA